MDSNYDELAIDGTIAASTKLKFGTVVFQNAKQSDFCILPPFPIRTTRTHLKRQQQINEINFEISIIINRKDCNN